jgi:hypothetical protein
MNDALSSIAERRIAQAIADGSLKVEGWRNKPLPLNDDNGFVPEDLKMAYKILKNSGYLPPEVETRKEVHRLEDLIARTEDSHQRLKQMKKLNVLLMKLDAQRASVSSIENDDNYYRKIVENITVSSPAPDRAGEKTK